MRKAIPLLMAGVFVADLMTPLGIAVPMLYVVPVFLAGLLLPYERAFYVTIGATALTYVGYTLSPEGGDKALAETNRLIAGILMWVLLFGAHFLSHIRDQILTFYDNYKGS